MSNEPIHNESSGHVAASEEQPAAAPDNPALTQDMAITPRILDWLNTLIEATGNSRPDELLDAIVECERKEGIHAKDFTNDQRLNFQAVVFSKTSHMDIETWKRLDNLPSSLQFAEVSDSFREILDRAGEKYLNIHDTFFCWNQAGFRGAYIYLFDRLADFMDTKGIKFEDLSNIEICDFLNERIKPASGFHDLEFKLLQRYFGYFLQLEALPKNMADGIKLEKARFYVHWPLTFNKPDAAGTEPEYVSLLLEAGQRAVVAHNEFLGRRRGRTEVVSFVAVEELGGFLAQRSMPLKDFGGANAIEFFVTKFKSNSPYSTASLTSKLYSHISIEELASALSNYLGALHAAGIFTHNPMQGLKVKSSKIIDQRVTGRRRIWDAYSDLQDIVRLEASEEIFGPQVPIKDDVANGPMLSNDDGLNRKTRRINIKLTGFERT